MYPKYTPRRIECFCCTKLNNFLISVVEKDGKFYYLEQCPMCKHYEDVRILSSEEVENVLRKAVK